MSDLSLNEFYKEVAKLTSHDLVKQKMLLPPDTIQELCATHCRTHRPAAESLLSSGDVRANKKIEHFLSVLQKAYPGEGVVIADFKHLELAQSMENLASALAVNTEKHFFEGSASHLTGITHLVKKPVIRWDFIIDEYQLQQSKLWGADAVRLTVALLDQSELIKFCQTAAALELEVIAEIHDQNELERIINLDNISAVYIKNDNLSDKDIQALLLQIPADTPALLSINSWLNSADKKFCCDSLVLDHSSYSTANGVKKLRESL